MKRNMVIKTHGVPIRREDGVIENYLPPFLPRGIHRVSITRQINFGLLIKTDKYPSWVNSQWFKEM